MRCFLIVMVAALAFFFSCEKEPKETPPETPEYSVAGTMWKSSVRYIADFNIGPGTVTLDMVFKDTAVNVSYLDRPEHFDETTWDFTGIYSYDHPAIVI